MTSGNPILDKNLECIEKYNPRLKEKLLNLPCLTNDIQLGETELKEPNLSFNGMFLHCQKGAEKEAKDIFAKSENTNRCINFIFGIGLGFLFKEACDQSKGSVIVYEPSLEILRVTLELVDFSNELFKKNVRIVSDYAELKSAFRYLHQYKSEIDVMVLDSYKKLFGVQIIDVIKDLEMLKASFSADINLINQKGLEFLLSSLDNLPLNLEATPLKEFKNVYEGKTALIVSAGPTLDLNVETIKKNKDKVVIFCVGPALKTLLKNGITPDFLNIVEISDVSGQVSDLDLSEIKMITAPYTHKSVQNLKAKQKFLFPSSATRGAQYWAHITGVDISEYVSKGTVSSAALASAKMLGCKKLVLVGQDLAFINNSCYSKNSSYSGIDFEIDPKTGKHRYQIKDYKTFAKSYTPHGEEMNDAQAKEMAESKIQSLNNRQHFIKGVAGEMVPTDIIYSTFVEVFKEFALENKNLTLINSSMLGAQIDGFENIPLDKALKEEKEIKKEELASSFKHDKEKILANLKNEKKYFENILSEMQKTKEYFNKFDREIQRRKVITEESYKFYTAITSIYDSLTEKYYKKNKFYQIISFEEHSQIQHYVNTTKESEREKISKIYSLVKVYFEKTEKRIEKILEAVDKQISIMEENISELSTKAN